MNILAIDTSSPQGIVALKTSSGEVKTLQNSNQMEHNRFILPAMNQLLAEAQLKLSEIDYFAASVGPGSFVGTRLAVAVTQGLAFGVQKPVLAISHLALIAEAYFDQEHLHEITVRLDARMQGFYQAQFHRDLGLLGEEQFLRFTEATPPEFTKPIAFHGKYLIGLAERQIAKGNALTDPSQLQPTYLHDEGNWKKLK